ncbi:hypothetical protein DSO57_1014072 [Entomophthora muscae]|uniref:Uncharacterized protein n=1 Tax=Entomophthora muscae TaxID=34485 RepID=A0ACC2TGK1_9FUNG|nr:hypothetical protein DSO57_1014072 [Entomophthora muscae]
MSHTPTNSLSPISKLVVTGPASAVMSPIEAESPLSSNAALMSPEPALPVVRPRRDSSHSYLSQIGANSTINNTAAQHLISDILATKDASLREKSKKATSLFSSYIQTLLSDSSVGLYQVTDLIHKKLPKMMEEKKNLHKLTQQVSLVNSDLDDARETLSTLGTITDLVETHRSIHRAILAATQIRAQTRR